ncbi:MAG: hypothetical protein ACI8U1_002692, partial [Rheinheimera aquimaris]
MLHLQSALIESAAKALQEEIAMNDESQIAKRMAHAITRVTKTVFP